MRGAYPIRLDEDEQAFSVGFQSSLEHSLPKDLRWLVGVCSHSPQQLLYWAISFVGFVTGAPCRSQ